jgi:hypothetical protein
MRAAARCKEHFQGDRCKFAKHHASPLAVNPQPQHQGSFTLWTGEGDSKSVVDRVTRRLRRSRRANRIFRALCGKQENILLVGTKERPVAKAMLDAIFKHFKGKDL